MPEFDQGTARWVKSSFSAADNCVEISRTDETVRIRDSKEPDGPVLDFSAAAFADFIAAVKRGEFHDG